MSQQLPWSEIEKHADISSCWVVIHGKVYDLTAFVSEHPGGPDILLDVAGGDGSELFEDIGHTSSARAMMTQYAIGEVED
ncbi:Cytochrome b5 [Geodia barretti]|uniref:Cytochrome b5 n=1 Tax=Geodia barretti TaxID=519541 RepID=A0AA35SLK6_GEOBA|nr:Cytochrome b5 [Geodia barretti]